MAHYAGRAGGVDTGSGVTGIKSWTLDYTVSIVDVTDFASAGVRDILPAVSQWSGSFEGYKDGTAQVLSVSAAVTLTLKETQTGTQVWTGSAYITGVHANTAFDGTVNYAYDYEGTGALTVPTA
jgi:predicted secreted protein